MNWFTILTVLAGAALLLFLSKYIKYVAYPVIFAVQHKLHFKGFINYVFIFNEIFTESSYDDVTPEQGKASTIFDIGGNIGLYSLYLNEKFEDLNIHTFEPIPDLYQDLSHNMSTNVKPTNKIITNDFGLSNKEESVTIHYFPKASGLSTIQPDLEQKAAHLTTIFGTSKLMQTLLSIFSKTHYVAKLVPIRLQRLSDYIEANQIDHIDIMKIDVEGYELQVLQGIDDQHFSMIHSLLIEVENYREGYQSAILSILEKHNYDITVKRSKDLWSFVIATRRKEA